MYELLQRLATKGIKVTSQYINRLKKNHLIVNEDYRQVPVITVFTESGVKKIEEKLVHSRNRKKNITY